MFFRPHMFRFVVHVSFGYDYSYYYQINSLKSLSPLWKKGAVEGRPFPSNSPIPQPPGCTLLSSFQLDPSPHPEPKSDVAELELTELPTSLGGLVPHPCLSQ